MDKNQYKDSRRHEQRVTGHVLRKGSRDPDGIFRQAKDELDALRKAEKRHKHKVAKEYHKALVATSDGERIKEYRSQKRDAILYQRVPERRCPCCRTTKPKSRAWVLLDDALLALFVGSADSISRHAHDGDWPPKLVAWYEGLRAAAAAQVCCRACFVRALRTAPEDVVATLKASSSLKRSRARDEAALKALRTVRSTQRAKRKAVEDIADVLLDNDKDEHVHVEGPEVRSQRS